MRKTVHQTSYGGAGGSAEGRQDGSPSRPVRKNCCCLRDRMEKAMATHSSTLAWQIPWTEEPGGLQSVGSQRVGHN